MRSRRHPKSINPQKRSFQCPECGTVSPATKWKGITNPGHIKTMYCYVCKKETEHIQVG